MVEKEIVNFDKFVKTVNLMAELLDQRELKITFSPFGVGIFSEKHVIEEAAKRYGLKSEDLKRNFKEIMEIVHILLAHNKDNFIKKRIKKDKKISNRVGLVESKIINKEIKEKYLLNKTYKSNILEKFDWEIVKKYHDKEEGHLDDFPVATLQFRIRHVLNEIEGTEKIERFTFECTEYGIEELINELNNIKEAFKKLHTSRGNVT